MLNLGNTSMFIGRIVNTLEIKTFGDSKVLEFTLARNRYTADKDHPVSDFIDCIAWNNAAERIIKYFEKGSKIGIIGCLQTQTYESTKYFDSNGKPCRIKRTELRVENVEFVDSNKSSGNNNSASSSATSYDSAPTYDAVDNSGTSSEDELPF